MTRRPRRVVTASTVALVLLLVSVVTIVEAVRALLGQPLSAGMAMARDVASTTSWNDPAAQVASATIALAGVVLLGAAVLPGRSSVLPLEPADPQSKGSRAGISRSSLRQLLRGSVLEVDGIRTARVRIRAGKIRISARSRLRNLAGLDEQVCASVEHRLAQVRLTRPPRLRVTVRKARSS